MKLLIILLSLMMSSYAVAKKCAPIDKDFLDYYGEPAGTAVLGLKVNVSEKGDDRILCIAESCGSAGCECALYVEVEGCPTRVLEFRGGHKLLGEKVEGMPSIEISKRGDPIAPASSKKYIWDKDRRKYVEAK